MRTVFLSCSLPSLYAVDCTAGASSIVRTTLTRRDNEEVRQLSCTYSTKSYPLGMYEKTLQCMAQQWGQARSTAGV